MSNNPFDTGGGGGGGGVSSITTGVGLTGGTITGSGIVALARPVAIANGGTGALTLADAQDNLGIGATTQDISVGSTTPPTTTPTGGELWTLPSGELYVYSATLGGWIKV